MNWYLLRRPLTTLPRHVRPGSLAKLLADRQVGASTVVNTYEMSSWKLRSVPSTSARVVT